VPYVEPRLAFVLAAMVGHLFGYEAALAIDALARRCGGARGDRASRRHGAPESDELLDGCGTHSPVGTRVLRRLRTGAYDGNLEASTAVGWWAAARHHERVAARGVPAESGKIGHAGRLVDDLTTR
jgi:glucosamine--fructose-6-phosphate aminotransferase (isomerizing)